MVKLIRWCCRTSSLLVRDIAYSILYIAAVTEPARTSMHESTVIISWHSFALVKLSNYRGCRD